MPLNKLQKEAVEYLEGPSLVLAGPGTGKTELLSSKVKYILENTDALPENILCLTYTDSAAVTMRARLRSMIGQAASKVNIHTYHAFGTDIIAEYKNYATEFDRNLESPIDKVTQHKIIKQIQKKLPAFDILKTAKTGDIVGTIANAKSARLSANDLEKIADDNIEETKKLNPELNKCLQNYVKGMKYDAAVSEVYEPAMEVLKEHVSPKPLASTIMKEANSLLFELNSVYEKLQQQAQDFAGGVTKKKPSVQPLTKWKTDHFELDENGKYRLKNRAKNLRLKSLANVMREYEKYLEKSGDFDFADMIQQAIKILKTDAGFKATLSERYQYILLDEFQDTNVAQAEIIRLLTDYEKPVVMAVGDDDQAIYAFQGANASNLLEFQNHYNAKVITPVENYRSGSEVLDFSYRVREQVTASFAKEHNILKRLRAAKVKTADISRHEFLEASAEYSYVASEIHKLVESGVTQSEIAVITPKHKYVLPLLPYLREYDDIHVAYEKRDNLFEDQKIHELLTLAQFVYLLSQDKNPSHLLLEILSFPFFEIPMVTAVQTVQKRYGEKKTVLDYLLESKDGKLASVANFLAELVRVSYNTPLEIFLDYLTGAAELSGMNSNFLKFYAKESEYSTFELYENLSVLREALRAHCRGTEVPKLKDLMEFVEDYQAAEESLTNTSPYQDAADSVQILTAHKSKGMEFSYVFIIATDDSAWGNAGGNNSFLVLPSNMQEIRHTGVTEDERLRLFFVAITRAKTNLIMTSSIKDFAGKSPARLEYLAEVEDKETGVVASPYLPKDSQVVIKHYDQTIADLKKANMHANWVGNYSAGNGELMSIYKKRLENYKLTATDLTTFIDIAYGGPQAFFQQKVLHAPDETYSESLSFGNLMHAAFEQVTNAGLTDEEAVKFLKDAAMSAAIPPEDLEYIIEKGERSLRESLKQFGALLRAEGARAEVNLYHEHLALGDVPLTGKIDHINIDEQNKTIEVYDFKTSDYKNKNWNSHPTLFKYRLQLGFYKLMLNLSPTYSKYKVKKAHILFVVPDASDFAVHDKIYEYNEKDEEELKALCKAVYAHIKSLDFLENKELFVEPSTEKNFKNIREFIKLVLDTASEI